MVDALSKSGCLGEGICVSPYCTTLQFPSHSRLFVPINVIIVGPVSFTSYWVANQNFSGGPAHKAQECSSAIWKMWQRQLRELTAFCYKS